MSTTSIATIHPALQKAMEGAPDLCVTLALKGNADKWVQFINNTINAAYPYDIAPEKILQGLPPIAGFNKIDWKARQFATFEISAVDALTLARWIDTYFFGVLDCRANYDLDITYENL